MSYQEVVKQNNLAVSEVFLEEVFLTKRIDAEYFRPEYIQNDIQISKKQTVSLDEATEDIKSFGAYSLTNQISYKESGVPYIRCTDVKDGYVDFSNALFIDEKSNKLLYKSEVKPEMVLLCMSGSVGNTAVADKNWTYPINSNQDIAKIILKKNYNPYFLSTFFNCKYGKLQINRLPVGSVQQHIFIWQIKTLKIPTVSIEFQKQIEKAVFLGLNNRSKSQKAYEEAEQMLLEELGLKNYKPNKQGISARELKECLAVNRFDAEYWQPKYDEIEKKVSAIYQKELDEIVSLKKGIETGSEAYSEKGKLFIRVSDFSIYGIDEGEKRISEELYEELKENYRPHKGEILFTKDGTIGISFALHEDVNAIISGAFLRMKPKIKINNDYLALVLNSLYCKFQIERMSGGAIISHLKPDDVKKIKIPILSDKKQQELSEKVLDSIRLRDEAKNLFEKAKRAVEIFIEKDEKEALNYLKN